jgi:ribonuclease Z
MKPIFHPYLVNKAHGDPVLYIDFLFDRRAILFDLGDISAVSPKKLLRITDIFISHTHMDHFFGFDHLLRILLGRDKHIRIFGPPGILDNVSGKLHGYTWNLVENYENNLIFEVTEVHGEYLLKNTFSCKEGFRPLSPYPEKVPAEECLLDTLTFQVKSVCLDHFTPCLAFCLQEKSHLNVNKVKLQEMGFPVGPWLKQLKDAIRAEKPDDTLLTIPLNEKGAVTDTSGGGKTERQGDEEMRECGDEEMGRRGDRETEGRGDINTDMNRGTGMSVSTGTDLSSGMSRERKEPLSRLKSIVDVSRGQKIVYVVDSAYTDSNREKVLAMAEGGDYFFCEAAFLEEDRDRAAQRSHLTAHQAGLLAQDARVRKLITFHFSPRYHGSYHLLVEEAMRTFKGHLP